MGCIASLQYLPALTNDYVIYFMGSKPIAIAVTLFKDNNNNYGTSRHYLVLAHAQNYANLYQVDTIATNLFQIKKG